MSCACFNPSLKWTRDHRPEIVICPATGPEILTGVYSSQGRHGDQTHSQHDDDPCHGRVGEGQEQPHDRRSGNE